jgi:hypothetical protein
MQISLLSCVHSDNTTTSAKNPQNRHLHNKLSNMSFGKSIEASCSGMKIKESKTNALQSSRASLLQINTGSK